MTTATDLRAKADALDAKADESWDRSDTDGFVTQWAHGPSADKARREADLADAGGVAWFPGLFTLDGDRVAAKLIDTRYGTTWAFVDANDKFTGEFVKAFPVRESTMTRKGYREDDELAPAKVVLRGNGGTGLSGATSVRVVTVRTDKGYPDDAVVM